VGNGLLFEDEAGYGEEKDLEYEMEGERVGELLLELEDEEDEDCCCCLLREGEPKGLLDPKKFIIGRLCDGV
jgi:hypothetical protein